MFKFKSYVNTTSDEEAIAVSKHNRNVMRIRYSLGLLAVWFLLLGLGCLVV